MAFLDGEADPETTLHLQKCEHCRDRAKTLEHEQKLLTYRLYRASCPSTDELGEFHLRMLPSEQMLIISQHVRECPLCTREIEQLKGFLGDLVPVTEGNLLQQAKILIARLVGGQDRYNAVGESAFALRGETEEPIIYETDGVVIVLDIQPTVEGKADILGQVAADDQENWTGAEVKLQQTDENQMTTVLDDLGAFRFEEAPSVSIQITITSPQGVEVQIPNIDIDV
jgi:hypothetical protein